MKNYIFESKCPISGKDGQIVFKFNTPLAGAFLRSKEDINSEQIYPLTLSFYEDSSLLMVNERIPPEVLFKNYFYKSGVSKKLINHFKKFSETIKNNVKPKKILEIGCNDFTLLNMLKSKDTQVLGVDPSDVSKQSCYNEKELVNDFFTFKTSENIKLNHGCFDLVISTNSFAHINDILDTGRGISNILTDDGIFIVEVHWLKSLIDNMQFPFIYHEHLYYYTVKSLSLLLKKVGLTVYDVEKVDTHGGSIRVYASKKFIKAKESVYISLLEEDASGATSLVGVMNFFSKLDALKNLILEKLKFYKTKNKRIVGYGASGQSTTLLNYLQLDNSILSFLVDDSPLKIGCISPGVHLDIRSKDSLDVENDIILVLAYTFFDEIKSRIGDANYIIPLPHLQEYVNDN